MNPAPARHTLRRALTVTTLALAALAPRARADAGPQLVVEENHIDLGIVQGAAPVRATFRISNAGDAPLHITKLEAACGCIAALATSPRMEPGEAGEIVATLDPLRVGDWRSKVIAVFSNDARHPVVYLTLSADVEHAVTLSDSVINFGSVPVGEPREHRLIVFHAPSVTLRLESVSAASDLLSFSWHYRPDPERPAFVVTVRLAPPTSPGPFADTLRIRFAQAHAPRIEVPVRAHVAGPVIASPPVLGLGLARPGTTPERTVTITAPTLPAFRVQRVESSTAYLIPALTVEAPGRYRVAVQVGPGTPRGQLNAVLRVYTNAREYPLLEVPVAAIVQ